MMIIRVYAVRDSKAKCFLPPFTERNDAMASRLVSMECFHQESQLAKFPEDFALYHLGEFDNETGILSSVEPAMVVQVVNLLK